MNEKNLFENVKEQEKKEKKNSREKKLHAIFFINLFNFNENYHSSNH